MQRRAPWLCAAGWLAAVVACTTAAADPPASPVARTWKHNMKTVEKELDFVEHQLLDAPGAGDLPAVAAAARKSARLLALGYGELEQPGIPEFARMARAAESWLLQLAVEAGSAHGDLAIELFQQGRDRHCVRCHDAAEAAAK